VGFPVRQATAHGRADPRREMHTRGG
jgi:hypothetical protein